MCFGLCYIERGLYGLVNNSVDKLEINFISVLIWRVYFISQNFFYKMFWMSIKFYYISEEKWKFSFKKWGILMYLMDYYITDRGEVNHFKSFLKGQKLKNWWIYENFCKNVWCCCISKIKQIWQFVYKKQLNYSLNTPLQVITIPSFVKYIF